MRRPNSVRRRDAEAAAARHHHEKVRPAFSEGPELTEVARVAAVPVRDAHIDRRARGVELGPDLGDAALSGAAGVGGGPGHGARGALLLAHEPHEPLAALVRDQPEHLWVLLQEHPHTDAAQRCAIALRPTGHADVAVAVALQLRHDLGDSTAPEIAGRGTPRRLARRERRRRSRGTAAALRLVAHDREAPAVVAVLPVFRRRGGTRRRAARGRGADFLRQQRLARAGDDGVVLTCPRHIRQLAHLILGVLCGDDRPRRPLVRAL
mmetsp:Transcript_75960/g.212976  ORF Transcript_75960/g.212976 Transcript_75960/m.212976 type:complete len:265 (-) Transcript_75960:395-1189(-)